MSADIVNLRLARKRKARMEAEGQASRNRVSFGLSKGERRSAEAERDSAARQLDGHRLGKPKPDDA